MEYPRKRNMIIWGQKKSSWLQNVNIYEIYEFTPTTKLKSNYIKLEWRKLQRLPEGQTCQIHCGGVGGVAGGEIEHCKKHGLKHNYSYSLEEHNKLKDSFCMYKLKISLSEPKILKAPDFYTACFFTYQHITCLFQKKKVQTSPIWVLEEEEGGNKQNKKPHTRQYLHKPLLMTVIYREEKKKKSVFGSYSPQHQKKKKIKYQVSCMW